MTYNLEIKGEGRWKQTRATYSYENKVKDIGNKPIQPRKEEVKGKDTANKPGRHGGKWNSETERGLRERAYSKKGRTNRNSHSKRQ